MLNKNSALRSTLCGVSLSLLAMSANAVVLEDETAVALKSAASTTTSVNPDFLDQIIVEFESNTYEAQSYAASSTIESTASNAMGMNLKYVRTMATGARVMQLPKMKGGKMSKQRVQALMQELAASPNVKTVTLDAMKYPMATPNDPQYASMWHYYESTGGLNVPTAWDTTSGSGVVVSVIDTGITSHPDLNSNVLPGYDFISSASIGNDGNGRDSDASDTGDATAANECGDGRPARSSSWHGTHVAGTVAAVGNNNTGIVGVAYGAKILPVRALGKCGGRTSDIADAIIWSAGGSVPGVPNNPNPAQVINLSLGGGGACDAASQAAINQAVSLGATVVVAAGNSNTNASNATPANCQNVVTVAATGRTGARASYSNFGSVVDVAAPGGDQSTGTSNGVLSTLNSGSQGPAQPSYAYYQGTSMATPHVAGVAALMYAVDSNITPAEVESLLKSTARSFPGTCSSCGTGIVDATAAVAALDSGSNPPGGDNILENGVAETGLSGATGSETRYTISVPAGATDLSFVMSGGSGDADLYVRFGAAPTTGTYDCRPWLNGNNETCTISNVQAGTYHVMIRGYSSFSGVSVVANYTEASTGPGAPKSGSASNLSGAANEWVDFTWDVDPGRSNLTISISGGSGDADLYVRRGSQPTTSAYDCRPYRGGNNETCTFDNPAAGTYYIRLRGYSAFSGVTLTASQE